MALRIPPGRAGRIWLVRRLEIARRGAELLDRKRQALLREQAHVRARGCGCAARLERRRRARSSCGPPARRCSTAPAGSSCSRGTCSEPGIARAVLVEPDGRAASRGRSGSRSPSRRRSRRSARAPPPSCWRAPAARRRARGGTLRGRERAEAELSAELARAGPAAAGAPGPVDPPARAGARPARPRARREPARAGGPRALAHPPTSPGRTLGDLAQGAVTRHATKCLSDDLDAPVSVWHVRKSRPGRLNMPCRKPTRIERQDFSACVLLSTTGEALIHDAGCPVLVASRGDT